MRIFRIIILTLTALIAVSGSSFAAQNYVSLAGEFFISHPDDWERVDYLTVDAFLAMGKAGRSVIDYDAVIAPESSSPFFAEEYLLVRIDTVGELSSADIDSLLEEMSAVFGKNIKYFPVSDFRSDLVSDAPNYDEDQKVISVVSEVKLNGVTTKKLLLAHKLYNKGIASFYFYAPPDKFEAAMETFWDILASFSTENIDQAHAREEVEIADVAGKDGSSATDESCSTAIWVAIAGVFIVIIIAVSRRKKKRSAN